MSLSLTDLPLDELRAFRADLAEPTDLDSFWVRTLEESRSSASPPRADRATDAVRVLQLHDLTFSGYAGERVAAWIVRPDDRVDRPTVVEFVGYGGGRGLPGEHLRWAAAGYVHVIMDTRGQGAGWSSGVTPDPHGSPPATPGFMTRGILDPDTYYYRRLITDAALLLDVVAGLPGVDSSRVAVTGVSQGGGLAIAAAALNPGRVSALLPDVPFLCNFPRSVTLTPNGPFTEISRFLAIHREAEEQVMRTLSYVDGAILARRVTAPSLFSVGLMDDVVLPSSVFSAYNALGSAQREMAVYTFNGHEGGAAAHWQRQVAWLDRVLS